MWHLLPIELIVALKFGFGMEISADQLASINAERNGRLYYDEAAATDVHGNARKQTLTTSPFVRTLEFGGSNGYWNGNHMTVQTEDCIDCLRVLFPEKYDYVFLYDHSSGHAKKRVGGLNVVNMNKGYGGENMRSTLIEQSEGYLGPYHDAANPRMVKVGQMHDLVYGSDVDINHGPFYLAMDIRSCSRHDTSVALSPDKVGDKEKTKKELVHEIMQTSVGSFEGENKLSKLTLRELRKIALGLEINTKKHVTHKVKPGWEGKGKGMLQILYERGWICEEHLHRYKKKVVDDAGLIVKEYSLGNLLEACTDFTNEKTQLEYVCDCLGVKVVITTKYHAEYAGEGIEYSWGAAKAIYRRYPLYSKKGKENFLGLVSKCISQEVLTTDLIRKFSRRARNYMLTYKSLEFVGDDVGQQNINTISHSRIENLQKSVACHRAAFDFDMGFILQSVQLVAGLDLEHEVENGPPKKKRGRKKNLT